MELADVFEKIANNARLTPQELSFLKLSMRQIQTNNSFITGLQNGGSDLNTGFIKSTKIISGNQSVSGSIFYGGCDLSINDNTLTPVTGITIRSGEALNGFAISGQTIFVPEPGRYRVFLRVLWLSGSSGYRQARIDWDDGSEIDTIDTPTLGTARNIVLANSAYINSNGFYVSVKHTNGSSISATIHVFAERYGQWRVLNT